MNTSEPLSRRWVFIALSFAGLLGLAGVFVVWMNVRGEAPMDGSAPTAPAARPALIERGAYLARAGNCMGCHTVSGGEAFAGGHGIDTPFGTVFAPNITADRKTGIGSWSTAEFWRAMHHGRSKDGRLLYPAFPYPSYTNITREDSDALFVYLQSVPSVERANKAHDLAFPYNTQAALALWRAMFFRAGTLQPDAEKTIEWNRGRYLVDGLAHCAACHSSRNWFGATGLNAQFAGGLMPDETWYAPSLASPNEAGLQHWPREAAVTLLKNGVSEHAAVSGPMADVVFNSTQYLTSQDLNAMVEYLASIPVRESERRQARPASSGVPGRGAQVYEQQCATCHGDNGQGVPSIYPALAGNRAVLLHNPNNLVQVIREGGFPPSTTGNPQPFGMPPFAQVLSQEDIAAVATFIRQAWGNAAPVVSTFDVHRVK